MAANDPQNQRAMAGESWHGPGGACVTHYASRIQHSRTNPEPQEHDGHNDAQENQEDAEPVAPGHSGGDGSTVSPPSADNGVLAGAPWQFRAFAWIATSFVLPILLLAFFLAQDAGVVPSLTRSAHATTQATNAALAAHIHRTDELINRLILAARISCENGARDQAARNNCANIR